MTSITDKLTAQWQHAANFLLGVWLVASPWLLAYVDQAPAALNASVVGVLVALVAAAALAADHEPRAHATGERGLGKFAPRLAEDWITAGLGAWLIVSPYILGFGAMPAASWTHFVVGVLVIALALWAAIAAQHADGAASGG
jgi:hypothetical protein